MFSYLVKCTGHVLARFHEIIDYIIYGCSLQSSKRTGSDGYPKALSYTVVAAFDNIKPCVLTTKDSLLGDKRVNTIMSNLHVKTKPYAKHDQKHKVCSFLVS